MKNKMKEFTREFLIQYLDDYLSELKEHKRYLSFEFEELIENFQKILSLFEDARDLESDLYE